jgi:ligand-binding SRPBCC domain-containing protein
MGADQLNHEQYAVESLTDVRAPAEAVWEFLTRPDKTGLRSAVPGAAGLRSEGTDLTRVGRTFTEYFTDPDTGAEVPCHWQTVAKSAGEWRLVAQDVTDAGLTIDLTYSLSSTADGTRLRRRMKVAVPPGKTMTAGWRKRLTDQRQADKIVATIAARIA